MLAIGIKRRPEGNMIFSPGSSSISWRLQTLPAPYSCPLLIYSLISSDRKSTSSESNVILYFHEKFDMRSKTFRCQVLLPQTQQFSMTLSVWPFQQISFLALWCDLRMLRKIRVRGLRSSWDNSSIDRLYDVLFLSLMIRRGGSAIICGTVRTGCLWHQDCHKVWMSRFVAERMMQVG